jgi:hypothetical protein
MNFKFFAAYNLNYSECCQVEFVETCTTEGTRLRQAQADSQQDTMNTII